MSSRDEKQRRRALAQAAEKAREPSFDTKPGIDSWVDVLAELDEIVMPAIRSHGEKLRKFPGLFQEASLLLSSGSMLQNPASTTEIAATETRLGLPLPPSYVNFLHASNGLLLPAYCKLASVSELCSYPKADSVGAELLEEHFGEIDEPSDEKYFNYTQHDDFCFRAKYARSAIALNAPIPGGVVAAKEFGWVLLVTEVSFDSGEYEIWEHGSWHNRRYRSFAEYFLRARQSIVESIDSFAV